MSKQFLSYDELQKRMQKDPEFKKQVKERVDYFLNHFCKTKGSKTGFVITPKN